MRSIRGEGDGRVWALAWQFVSFGLLGIGVEGVEQVVDAVGDEEGLAGGGVEETGVFEV